MKCIGVLIASLVVTLGYTQAPDTLWTKTYGGTGNDVGNSIKQTSDGGYIIAGYTESFGAGGQDVWLLKTDANGDTAWTRTYGGSENDWAAAVRLTNDGGYVILANTADPLGGCLIWLIKTNNTGDTAWTKIYGSEGINIGYDVQQTSDSGYVMTGTQEIFIPCPAIILLKTDASGDTAWCRYFGNAWDAKGFSVCETFDGGYVIGGDFTPPGRQLNAILLKTDADGIELWREGYGGHNIRSVRQMVDSGYVVCGSQVVFDLLLWIFRTDTYGNDLWTQYYGDSTNQMMGYSMDLTDDNALIFTGPCGIDAVGFPDVFLFKTDENGDSLWCVVYGDSAYADCGKEVLQTSDGGYIVVGSTESYGAGGSDVWIIKTEPDLGVTEGEKNIVNQQNLTTTIFHGSLQLPNDKDCKVFDITGRVVEPNRIAPGIYFVEIDNKITQKVIKVR